MSKLNKFIAHRISSAIIFLVAFIAAIFNYALRFSYVFVDSATFEGLAFILWIVSVVNAFVCFFLLWTKVNQTKVNILTASKTKLHAALTWISFILTVFYLIYDIVAMKIAGESIELAFKMLFDILPVVIVMLLILALVLILPSKNHKFKIITAWFVSFAMAFTLIAMVFPCYTYDFVSNPVVFDNGKGYSVVFATNDTGTGFVDYVYQDESYRKYDENNGRLNGDSSIHTIKIPYEHLNNNDYSVGSKRVIDELSYGGRYGKEIVSSQFKLNVKVGDIEILTISDWHTQTKKALKTISALGEFDYVFMLGDSVPGLMYEKEVVDYLISFGGDVAKGSVPVIFTRGNHETRGKAAAKLAGYLGMDKFYFTSNVGGYNLIVLDSGEDKKDNHPEYGGMVNYNQYRKDMIDWLETLNSSDKKTIALSHDVKICIEDELSLRAYQKLSELNVRLIAGGHTHKAEFTHLEHFDTFTDGGRIGKDFAASKIKLTSDNINLVTKNMAGDVVLENTLSWN